MQQLFFRLIEASGLPAGDLIEQWTGYADQAGLQDHLADFQMHRFDGKLLESLSHTFQAFCAHILAEAGLPDVSLSMRELLRYCFCRRRATKEAASFIPTLDVHGITVDPRFNKMTMSKNFGIPENHID